MQYIFLCTGCVPTQYEPQEGVWYCEELQIQLSYKSDAPCFVIENDEKIVCGCGSDRGVNYIQVLCQETDNPYYYLGEMVFCAEIISLNDVELIVYDESTQEQYAFYRID